MELLTAVVIVSVLAALLLSGIQRFRGAGNTTKCLQNLRQLGLAFQQFVSDNNGVLPDKSPTRLYPYLDLPNEGAYRNTAFTCPQLQSNPDTRSADINHRSYAVNLYATTEKLLRGSDRFMRIERPSQMLLYTEAALLSGHSATTAPDGTVGYQYLSNVRLEDADVLFYPHFGRQNGVFADGSARQVTKEDIQQKGSYNVPFWCGYKQ